MEDAFVFQIPLITSTRPDVRYPRKQVIPPGICEPGWSYLLDMNVGPTWRLDTTFDNASIYLHRTTIDELAYETGRLRAGGIMQRSFGEPDPIMFHLAQSWLPVLENPAVASPLFIKHLARAVYEHIMTKYGGTPLSVHRGRAGLAPWQMRRIKDFIEANLPGNPSISDLARECDLSPSYFAEAFKLTTGISPHQWLLKRRVERAKALLRGATASLASVASDCGFFDQGHFSRVFTRFENSSPSEWRRHNRLC